MESVGLDDGFANDYAVFGNNGACGGEAYCG
jgi:hypothetical protein